LDADYDLTDTELLLWNTTLQRIEAREHPTNIFLDIIHSRFRDYKNECLKTNSKWDLETVLKRTLYNENITKNENLIEFANKYLLEKINRSTKRKVGTKENYRVAIESLILFLKYRKLEKISIDGFTKDNAEEYKTFLESKIEELPQKKINSKVTSSSKIKNLKPIFNYAIEKEIIKKNPFNGIKLIYRDKTTGCLTIYQIKSIVQLQLHENHPYAYARDLFIFMCFTGFSYIDVMELTTSSIQENGNNSFILNKNREKTSVAVRQIITKRATNIMLKYCTTLNNLEEKKVFYYESLESINEKLKSIALLCGINMNLSTKIGRTSFREILYASGVKDDIMIGIYCGWSKNKNIDIFYFNSNESKLKEVTQMIDAYIENNL
jgi:site-specific recombinase XerD